MIEFPIVLNYWKPRRNDPFGESICDKLDDKQIAKTILFNLNIIKAKKEALGGDFIWNSRLIKNREDILKPTTNGRNIFVDTVEPLQNVGMELPRSQIKADSIQLLKMKLCTILILIVCNKVSLVEEELLLLKAKLLKLTLILLDYLTIKLMLGEIRGSGLNGGSDIKRISLKLMRNLLFSYQIMR